MKLKVYQYSKCGTCRKALKFLTAKGIDFIAVPIRETPPTPDELERMLERYGGQIRKLFNTSGQDYRNSELSFSWAGVSCFLATAVLGLRQITRFNAED